MTTATDLSAQRVAVHTSPARPVPVQAATAYRNHRILRVLERLAGSFEKARVPLLVLKGAALNLTLYRRSDARPMGDLDLMVQASDLRQAGALLESVGAVRTATPIHQDFFPRFHYETEYTLGAIYPIKIDLHVRPFRPLRYARTVPSDAFWSGAVHVAIGDAAVLMPSPADMLLHLLVHSAVHGNSRQLWLDDIALWVEAFADDIDWEEFVAHTQAWQLTHAAQKAMHAVERRARPVFPAAVSCRLTGRNVSWRDRLALWQAPRDADHPAMHILMNAICTPDWRFAAGYILAATLPDTAYMTEEHGAGNPNWLPMVHLRRWLKPLLSRFTPEPNDVPVRLGPSPIHGAGVFAGRRFVPGEFIARFHGRPANRDGRYVIELKSAKGHVQRYELNGNLRYLNHSCAANAMVDGFDLKAAQTIRPGEELTIDYGPSACDCRKRENARPAVPSSPPLAKAC